MDSSFRVHSLHSYFYLPGDPKMPIIYQVDRIRDGRSFVARRVAAFQHGQAIFSSSISFQRSEKGFEHQDSMPTVPAPEDLPTFAEIVEKVSRDRRMSEKVRRTFVERFLDFPFPIEIRRVSDPFAIDMLSAVPRPPKELNWMRVKGRIQNTDPFVHACGLAFLSDWYSECIQSFRQVLRFEML